MSPLNRFKVLTGEAGLDNIVEASTVIDAPDSVYWTQENEFVMTNAFAFKDEKDKLIDWVIELANRRVAALAIKVNRFLFSLPDKLVDKGKELNLPILVMPDDCAYVDVFAPLYRRIYCKEHLEESQNICRTYYDSIASNVGIKALVELLASQINLPILLFDSADNLLVYAGEICDQDNIRLGDNASLIEEMVEGKHVFRFHLAGNKGEYGSLAILGSGECLSGKARLIINELLPVFTVEMIHEEFSKTTLENEFIRDVLTKEIQNEKTITKKMIQYDLDFAQDYLCIVMALDDLQNLYDSEEKHSDQSNLLRIKRRFVRNLTGFLKGQNRNIRVVEDLRGATILWPVEKKFKSVLSKKDALTIATKMLSACQKWLEGHTVSMGIAATCTKLPQCYIGYNQALQALRLGSRIYGAGTIMHFDDLGPYRILSEIDDVTKMEEFYQSSIGKLIEYDENNNTEFFKTFQVYCHCNFNLKKAAEHLHLHYNSLQYRLRKISEITNIDLTTSEGLFLLMLGLKIKQII